MSWDPNDPYGYYGSNGDFPQENPRPEDSPEWEDVPRVNRKYVRKIPREVIQEGYEHLKTDQIYVIEALVESLEINEELLVRPDTNERMDDKVVTSLKILNLPPVELSLAKNEMKSDTILVEQTASRGSDRTQTLSGDKSSSKSTAKTASKSTSKSTGKSKPTPSDLTEKISSRSSRRTNVDTTSFRTEVSIERTTTVTRRTVIERSATTLSGEFLPIPDYFHALLRHTARVARKAEKEAPIPEYVEDQEEEPQEDQTEEGQAQAPVQTPVPVQQPPAEEYPPPPRTKIDVMEGKSVLVAAKGCAMLQKLQQNDIRVLVNLLNEVETEEGPETEMWPLGQAVLKVPQAFYTAVLRRGAAEDAATAPLYGEQGEEVAVANVVVTLVTLGQGAEVGIHGEPRYTKVRPIQELPLVEEEVEEDPLVHPRLAVTLMNLEPSREIYKTGSQIIQEGLQKEWISLEDAEGFAPRFSKYNHSNCRWQEIIQQSAISKSTLESKSNLSVGSISMMTSFLPEIVHSTRHSKCYTNVAFPGRSDPEIRPLWREVKQKCAELWEEAAKVETKRRTLYEELEELLEQDKPENWGEEVTPITSNMSKPSQQEDQASKTASRSGKSSLSGSNQPSVQ